MIFPFFPCDPISLLPSLNPLLELLLTRCSSSSISGAVWLKVIAGVVVEAPEAPVLPREAMLSARETLGFHDMPAAELGGATWGEGRLPLPTLRWWAVMGGWKRRLEGSEEGCWYSL